MEEEEERILKKMEKKKVMINKNLLKENKRLDNISEIEEISAYNANYFESELIREADKEFLKNQTKKSNKMEKILNEILELNTFLKEFGEPKNSDDLILLSNKKKKLKELEKKKVTLENLGKY
jgi:hypothetical protein